MDSLEHDLDIVQGRLSEMEKRLSIIQERQNDIVVHINQTQFFLMKLARNHSEITKRMKSWPFIAVENEQ